MTITALIAAGCFAPERREPDADVVPFHLNDAANTVLRNVITECGSSRGQWAHDMGPGCPRIWATRLGLTAGLRRQRDDLVALGRATARRQNADVTGLIVDAIIGEPDQTGPVAYGLPALLISGTLDGRGVHYHKFRMVADRALAELDAESLDPKPRAGLAVVLAEIARIDPDGREERLARARELAAGIEWIELRAFALAAVARVTTVQSDIDAAREAVEAATPEFRVDGGRLVFDLDGEYVLSLYLALTNALADMAQLTGNPYDRARAQALIEFVFSDRLFDGRFLLHDGSTDGRRSREFCSGCNLNALYLVDRLWGDTWKIDPLPPLPKRPDPWVERRVERVGLFRLHSGQHGTTLMNQFGLTIGYTEVPPDDDHPRGAVRIWFSLGDGVQSCRFRREKEQPVLVPLDENDEARYTPTAEDVVEGEYDAERSGYTFVLGPRKDRTRPVTVVATRLVSI